MPRHGGGVRLPTDPARPPRATASAKAWFLALVRSRRWVDIKRVLMKSLRVAGPLRVRPAFVVATTVTLLALGALGFHPTLAGKISPPVPFSDKILHFFSFFLATLSFYHIFVVDSSASHLLWWRLLPELLTVPICLFVGGVISEFVQATLPYKTFQWGDILANLLGGSLGLYLARELARRRRAESEVRRLYLPVHGGGEEGSEEDSESGEDAEDWAGTYLPDREPVQQGQGQQRRGPTTGHQQQKLDNVWTASDDEDDEGPGIFSLGGEDDDDSSAVEERRRRERQGSDASLFLGPGRSRAGGGHRRKATLENVPAAPEVWISAPSGDGESGGGRV